MKMTNIPCNCCNAESTELVGKIPDSAYFSGNYLDVPLPGGELYRCHKCNYKFRYPQIDKSRLDDLYKKLFKKNQEKVTKIIEYKTFDKDGVENKGKNNKSNFDEDYYKMASENKDVEGFDNDFSNKNDEYFFYMFGSFLI